MKRILSLVLALMLLFSSSLAVIAAESRSSSYINSCSVWLTKTSSTSFNVNFSISGKGMPISEIGVNSIVVEVSSDGENWEYDRKLTPSSYPQMLSSGVSTYAASVPCSGITGNYYRVMVAFHVKNGNGTGIQYAYSGYVYL